MSETDLKPPVPPHPKVAAKHGKNFLSGRPKWQYIAGITVLVGVAFIMWRRSQADAAATGAVTPTDPTGATTGSPDSATYPSPDYGTPTATQGAYAGGDDPSYTSGDGSAMQYPSFTLNIGPGVTGGTDGTVPTDSTLPASGGGLTKTPATVHKTPAKAGAVVATPDHARIGKSGNVVKPPDPKFPNWSPAHGWYKIVHDQGGKGIVHVYKSGLRIRVKGKK